MPKYSIIINGKSVDLQESDVASLNLFAVGDNTYHHLDPNNQSLNIEVVDLNLQTTKYTVKVNGKLYTGQIELPIDLLIKELGMDKVQGPALDKVVAPMPGLVLDISVSQGQSVTQGEYLLILEAMKMENVIKSPVDGVIKSIDVSVGESISKSQVLITYETD